MDGVKERKVKESVTVWCIVNEIEWEGMEWIDCYSVSFRKNVAGTNRWTGLVEIDSYPRIQKREERVQGK